MLTAENNLTKLLRFAAEFIRLETTAGILLFSTAVLALALDNSPLHDLYHTYTHMAFSWSIGKWHFSTSTFFWVNDVFMTVFFLLVGLEIKREVCIGELNSARKIALPGVAALGGMIVPALVYLAFNHADPIASHGWAIPTATDIAFALGIIALLGRRVPVALKLYLMALAIFDDLGAILIIAFFYQSHIYWPGILGILGCLAILFILNRCKVQSLLIYCSLGVALWGFFLYSGIHPTLAGVLLALLIPLKPRADAANSKSPLYRLELGLHPWVAYAILPLFSFVNAGVSFAGLNLTHLCANLPLGILLGLFIGKQVGVFGASWLAIRMGVAAMPKDTSWASLYATAIICGVGFTMSLFIGNLAFTDAGASYAALVRFGVLIGSCLSGLLGYLLLRQMCPPRQQTTCGSQPVATHCVTKQA